MKVYAAILASVITIVAILGGVFITKASSLSSPERYFQKGKRYYEMGNYDEAINNLNEYLRKAYRYHRKSRIYKLFYNRYNNLRRYSAIRKFF